MKKIFAYSLLTLTALFSASLHADGAATFSGATSSSTGLVVDNILGAAAAPILSTTLKVPGNKKSLLIGVSLESSLITNTKKKGLPEACAGVEVTVKIDGVSVAPGTVRYTTRCQKYDALYTDITTKLTTQCVDADVVNPDNSITPKDGVYQVATECTFTDQDIAKILSTTSANHFNFIAPDVGEGEHTITVEASVSASAADSNIGSAGNTKAISSLNASSFAAINVGTLSVQVVRSAKPHHEDHDGEHGHDITAE
jgi:hypothetical protein